MPIAPQSQRAELVERLRARHDEIEAAVRARVYALADAEQTTDPSYAEGLRTAIVAALDYGLAALEASEEHPPPVPVELIAQARLAARNGVGIDTVLRRYFGGYVLLGEFLAQEAAVAGVPAATLKRLMRVQAAAFDRLIATVSEEHGRGAQPPPASTERLRLRLVQRLLAGEPVDVSDQPYDFEGHHLGLVVAGDGADTILYELATALDRRCLLVCPDDRTAWAWLGGRRCLDSAELVEGLEARLPTDGSVALGESATGLDGWRLTHRQATAALSVALRGERLVRYAEVALLAAVLQDDLLSTSLRRLYLDPLGGQPDGGEMAKETLRAYFAADRNASSAAAALGVNRNTIAKRLRAIESVLGRRLSSCGPELEASLRLAELDRSISR